MKSNSEKRKKKEKQKREDNFKRKKREKRNNDNDSIVSKFCELSVQNLLRKHEHKLQRLFKKKKVF